MTRIEEFTILSKEIAENIVNENIVQKNALLVPPSYFSSDRVYPVVYFLHGFSQSYRQIYKLKSALERFMTENGCEFIFVSVNGHNRYGGSFWADSPVTGRWTRYLVHEVVSYVDENYRTLRSQHSRALCGFSMGAGASISLVMKHPEIFQTAYALCPGVLGTLDLETAMSGWAQSVINAYAAAFSPDPGMDFPHGKIPLWNGMPEDDDIIRKWLAAFPGSAERISEYKSRDNSFGALRMDYALRDEYRWLVDGVSSLSGVFTAAEIPHTLNAYDITHEISLPVIVKSMLPFLSENMLF